MTNWSLARCISYDPEIFFEEDPAAIEIARNICRDCPISVDCGREALARGEAYGVWGGEHAEVLKKINTKRRRVKCPGCTSQELRPVLNMQVCTSCGLSWRQ